MRQPGRKDEGAAARDSALRLNPPPRRPYSALIVCDSPRAARFLGGRLVQDLSEVLRLWSFRCARCSDAFYAAATYYKRVDTTLTILNVSASIAVLALSVGRATFEPILGKSPVSSALQLAVASIVVVISSVLQYVLSCSALSVRYKEVGVEYASLRRKIELLRATPTDAAELEALRAKYHEVATIAPLVPKRIWNKFAKSHPEIGQLEQKSGGFAAR